MRIYGDMSKYVFFSDLTVQYFIIIELQTIWHISREKVKDIVKHTIRYARTLLSQPFQSTHPENSLKSLDFLFSF